MELEPVCLADGFRAFHFSAGGSPLPVVIVPLDQTIPTRTAVRHSASCRPVYVSVRKHNAPFQGDTVAVWCVAAPHRWPRIAFGAAPASRLSVSP